MAKLNVCVILALSGVLLTSASLVVDICPTDLQDIIDSCGSVDINLDDIAEVCLSEPLNCIGDKVPQYLNINETTYGSLDLEEALVSVGAIPESLGSCLDQVDNIVETADIDQSCEKNLVGAFVKCACH